MSFLIFASVSSTFSFGRKVAGALAFEGREVASVRLFFVYRRFPLDGGSLRTVIGAFTAESAWFLGSGEGGGVSAGVKSDPVSVEKRSILG